jgi:glutathionylspermidine synthase
LEAGDPLTPSPYSAGRTLSREEWIPLRTRAIFEFCKWDVQCEDHSVLSRFPLLIEPATALVLNETAEALAREAISAEEEILAKPHLISRLGLPLDLQKNLQNTSKTSSGVHALRVMRFDFHATTEGWRISEVNADVPGGFIEASGWNALFAGKLAGTSAPLWASELYARALHDVVGHGGFVALVHATAYSDDRQVMQHLARRFSACGLHTCLLSPAHLRWIDGRAEIRANFASGWPDAIVRFFPAEWLPNLGREDSWKAYFQKTRVPVSNPGSAILLQTKRFPLVWEELRTDLSTWRRLLPRTVELSGIRTASDDTWVLKPALGRVGERIGIRGVTPESDLRKIIQEARRSPQQWVAQKRFEILPMMTPDGEKFPCIGVFTIGGKAAGFYGRIAEKPIITQDARDVAVLIKAEVERKMA